MGFYGGLMVFYGGLMGFYGPFNGILWDLMGFNGIYPLVNVNKKQWKDPPFE